MLIQTVGQKVLAYVENRNRDYMSVADEFGMVDHNSLADYVSLDYLPYVNQLGVSVPSVHLNGRTVDIHVVDDSVTASNTSASAIANALNYFPQNSKLELCGFSFTSKFKFNAETLVSDSTGKSFSMRQYGKKDLKGIYGLMTSLGDNNGKLYEPLLARYVYTSYQMPRHRQLVGYFNLGTYLNVIRDKRYGELFTNMGHSKSLVYLECRNTPPVVRITGVDDGQAILKLDNIEGVYDAKKLNEFEPYVIMTRRPLKIKDMRFPWTKVHFDKVDVFMTPLMSLSDAWESLEGGINLLSELPNKLKNTVF